MRTIIYPHKTRQAQGHPPTESPTFRGPRGGTSHTVKPAEADDYLARLAKHVPAEALAILLLFAGQFQDEKLGWRLAALLSPAIIAVLLDRDRRRRLSPEIRPEGWIYDLFVVVAFFAWALGTTEMARNLLGINETQSSLVVIVVAFGLSYVDDPLGERFERKGKVSTSKSNAAGQERLPGRGAKKHGS